jgi:hypothetical protein
LCQQWSYVCADHKKYDYPPAQTITTPVQKSLPTHVPQEACQQVEVKASQGSKTTSKQSQCTVAQQFRWFKLYKKALCFLRTKNTEVCNKTGKSFGELINHFILGGNETNLIADADGDLRIVGEKGKKKHKKKWPIIEDRSPCTALELLQATMALLFSY